MRRVISILLVTFLLANLAGFYVYFYFRLQEIRREMHAEIARTSPELLHKISLSFTEYMMTKKGNDEVKWKGIMYDIASIQFKGDQVELLALADYDETNLFALLTKITHSASKDAKTQPTALMQYLGLTFTIPGIDENLLVQVPVIISHNTQYFLNESHMHTEILTPPPRT